jgi:hypothetical protein
MIGLGALKDPGDLFSGGSVKFVASKRGSSRDILAGDGASCQAAVHLRV